MERDGIEGWDRAEDLSYIKRTFNFNCFEAADIFIQNVGKYCSVTDHHPEWNLSEGPNGVGCMV